MFIDPVCGMSVTEESSAETIEHGGAEHHFCSTNCATKFRANPEKYLAKVEASRKTDETGAVV